MIGTKDDAVRCLDKWLMDEFGNGIGEHDERVQFVYNEYKNGDRYTFEEWFADFENIDVTLELCEEGYHKLIVCYEFNDYLEMIKFFEENTYNGLVMVADEFAENNMVRI